MSVLRWTPEQLAAHQKRAKPIEPVRSVQFVRPLERMNKTETRYSQLLECDRADGLILAWRFEAIRLKLAQRTTYTPDFMVETERGIEFHEVKGCKAIFRDDARVKIKIAAEMYPRFRFVVVYPKKGGGWTFEEVG